MIARGIKKMKLFWYDNNYKMWFTKIDSRTFGYQTFSYQTLSYQTFSYHGRSATKTFSYHGRSATKTLSYQGLSATKTFSYHKLNFRFFLYCTARQHPAQKASTQRHGQPAPTDI